MAKNAIYKYIYSPFRLGTSAFSYPNFALPAFQVVEADCLPKENQEERFLVSESRLLNR